MSKTAQFGYFVIACAALYGIYMLVIRVFLIRKSGKKIWKAFIPVLSVHEEYDIAGRPGWFWWHIVTMLPADFFMIFGFAALIESYIGVVPPGLSRHQVSWVSTMMITASVMLFIFSLPARFAKAYGLQQSFGEKPNLDYAFGLVVFPWSFKARLAFSRSVVYTPGCKKPKRKRKKISLPHFFPEVRSRNGN